VNTTKSDWTTLGNILTQPSDHSMCLVVKSCTISNSAQIIMSAITSNSYICYL